MCGIQFHELIDWCSGHKRNQYFKFYLNLVQAKQNRSSLGRRFLTTRHLGWGRRSPFADLERRKVPSFNYFHSILPACFCERNQSGAFHDSRVSVGCGAAMPRGGQGDKNIDCK